MCVFFYLVKATLWLLHVLFPIISLLLHIGLMSLWAYGIHIQTSPDTIDPDRINRGAPWFLTKSCSIVEDKNVRSYCVQAKSAFAVSIIMLYVPLVSRMPRKTLTVSLASSTRPLSSYPPTP